MLDRGIISLHGAPVAVTAVSAPPAFSGQQAGGPASPPPDPQEMLDRASRASQNEREELTGALSALREGLEQVSQLREQLVKEAEDELVQLAIDIARKVLMQEIQAGRYEIDPIVREALKQVPPRQDVTAHLQPDDWARCQMAQEASGQGQEGQTRFVADPSVPRGECVLETAEGVVQSAVEEHLERISDALRRVD